MNQIPPPVPPLDPRDSLAYQQALAQHQAYIDAGWKSVGLGFGNLALKVATVAVSNWAASSAVPNDLDDRRVPQLGDIYPYPHP